MEATIQNAQQMENIVGTSKPPSNVEDHDSNDDDTTVEISSAPMLGFDDDNYDDIQQPLPSSDCIMVLDDEESSGIQHSTCKPKKRKRRKLQSPRKNFSVSKLSLIKFLLQYLLKHRRPPKLRRRSPLLSLLIF